MNWEEKSKSIVILGKYLRKPVPANNPSQRYFTLFETTDYISEARPYYNGLNTLEALIKQGQIKSVKEIRDALRGQLEFFKKHLALAKKYVKAGGEINFSRTSNHFVCENRINDENADNQTANVDFLFGIKSDGKYLITSNYDNMDEIHKWLLYAHRLLDHCEQRCLRHPRFKEIR